MYMCILYRYCMVHRKRYLCDIARNRKRHMRDIALRIEGLNRKFIDFFSLEFHWDEATT